jgi:hypothetical protein
MSDFADLIDNLEIAILEQLGELVTYYPVIGKSQELRIFPKKKDNIMGGLGANLLETDGRIIEVHAYNLFTEPQVNDMFDIQNKSWRARSVRSDDRNNKIFLVDLVPV